MQSWKRKKNTYLKHSKAKKKWPTIVLAVFFIFVTIGLGFSHFPGPWNTIVGAESRFAIQAKPFRLGLDLQGGTHLVYETDMSAIPEDERSAALEGARDVIERRINAFGVSEPLVQTTDSGGTYRIIVELAGVLDVNEAIEQIGETPILEFKEVNTEIPEQEITPEDLVKLETLNASERQTAQAVLDRALAGESFQTLIDAFSGRTLPLITENHPQYGAYVKEIIRRGLGAGQIVPALIEDEEGIHLIRLIEIVDSKRMDLSHLLICFEGKTGCQDPISAIEASVRIEEAKKEATPENFDLIVSKYSTDLSTKETRGDLGWLDPGIMVSGFELEANNTEVGNISSVVETEFGYHLIYKKAEEPVKAYSLTRISFPFSQINDVVTPADPWKNTELSGKNLKRSSVQFDPNTNTPYVTLEFDDEGSDLFAEITKRNIGQYVAIFLDGQAISVPVVNQAIYGGQAVIEGGFTLEEAKLLAQRLNAGALPVPVDLLSQQTIGPTLGKASLEKSIFAGLVGLVLVAIFMMVMYRLPGLIAILTLLLYSFLNLTAYKLFGVTLTLSGIAGLVLSLGIAVDANVLIFERLKEELRSGRDFRSALDEAFRRSWSSIRDGNFTTLISAIVLYGFSSSFIKGFALTLSLGIFLSLFTAIVVTRIYMTAIYFLPFFQKPLWHGRIKPSK